MQKAHFASSAFPGPPLHHWVPSDKAAAHFGSRSHSLLGAPRKWGKKKEKIQSWLTPVTLVGFVGADPEQRQARNNGSKFTRSFCRNTTLMEKRRRRMGLESRVA